MTPRTSVPDAVKPGVHTPSSSILSAEEVYAAIGKRSFIKRVFAFDTIDSTNSFARTILSSSEKQPTLIVAERQTHGRGRFDRRWESEPGANLTISVVVKSRVPPERYSILPLCVAELVARAVQLSTQANVQTKWPNDLLIDGKKFCGILIESEKNDGAEFLIIGLGMNVNQRTFPAGFNATSLFLETGNAINRVKLLREIMNKLQWLSHIPPETEIESILRKWKERSTMFGKSITIESGAEILTGLAKTVASDGALIVKVGDVDRKFYSGDVTIQR